MRNNYLLAMVWILGLFTGCDPIARDDTSARTTTTAAAVTNNSQSDAAETTKSVHEVASAEEETAAKPPETNQQPIEITFEDINLGMQQDMVFRPWLVTDRLRELQDKLIRIQGYMLPFDRQTGIKEFVLLRNTECKFGQGGQADHLISVKLQGDLSTRFHNGIVEVDGVLRLNPFTGPDGNTWSIYDLEGCRVKLKR